MEYPMTGLVKRFAKAESGATAIEYALIAAGIALAIVAAVKGLGTQLNDFYTNAASELSKV